MGPKVAEVCLDWFDDGLNSETFFIVGHSLGGQMSGIIGRSVYKKSRGETKIERISALDPALPTFYPALGTPCVNKNDAKFVDIIHTDAWLYGIPISTGHADFWPNSGKTLQPGCPRRSLILSLSDNGMFKINETQFDGFFFKKKRKNLYFFCCRLMQSSTIMVVLG